MHVGDTLVIEGRIYSANPDRYWITADSTLVELSTAAKSADATATAARSAYDARILDRDLEQQYRAANRAAEDAHRAYDAYLRRLCIASQRAA